MTNDSSSDHISIEDELSLSPHSSDNSLSLALPSNLSSSSLSSSTNSNKPKRVRPRRNRKRLPPRSVAHLPELRILKSDIRRRYVEMLLKVINNYDVSSFNRFLKHFCTSDFRFTEVIPDRVTNRNYINGLENCLKSWAYCFETMPDCVFNLSEAKVIVRLGAKGSRVACKARLVGTKIYQPKNPLFGSSKEFEFMQELCLIGNNLTDLTLDPNDPDQIAKTIQLMNETIELGYVEKPVRIVVEGVFVFHIDECNRIVEVRNDCDFYQELC
jgi:hypothetical protein